LKTIRLIFPVLAGVAIATATGLLIQRFPVVGQPIQVRVQRWLEVREVGGTVTYYRGGDSQPARTGMRLEHTGDGIATAVRSQSVLAVDTGIGVIHVSERTLLRVLQMRKVGDGGHVTRLSVSGGQAHLRIRRFTHSTSELEIQTPAGWSAVRGTYFGVTVHPDGKTGVATREGNVETRAQGHTVAVQAGFQSLVIPGEAPTTPTPIPAAGSARLQLQRLVATGEGTARIVGKIDPVNLLLIVDSPQVVDRGGKFDVTVAMPQTRRISVTVITPLGERQAYELAVPQR
jgi:hypothetical protein